MKRSGRQVKLNPKYFDVEIKLPKLDSSMNKMSEGQDDMDASLDVNVSENSSLTAASAQERVKVTNDRSVRQVKPNPKYFDVEIKLPKLDSSMIKMSEGQDDMDASMDVDALENSSPTAASTQERVKVTSDRSVRQVKLNPKYFDVEIKLPKLDSRMIKMSEDQDDMDASMDVDVSENLSLTAASAQERVKVTNDRPVRQIKPNSKYLDHDTNIRVAQSFVESVIKSEHLQLSSNSAGAQTTARPGPHRKPKIKIKEETRDSSVSTAASCKSNLGLSRTKSRTSSRVKVDPKLRSQDSSDDDNPKRPCGRSGCPDVAPMCFAGVSERCTGNKYTSRWNHISVGEHYCNECFEYFRGRRGLTGFKDDGLKEYETWKAVWSSKAQRTASISGYLVDQVLPFWACCQKCSKWRQLPRSIHVTPEVLASFTCAMLASWGNKIKHKDKDNACETPEDKRVQCVRSSEEFFQSRPTPCLRQSLAAQFLTKYYPDGVGLSPTESVQAIPKAEKKKLCPFVVPFAKENRPLHASGVTPDMMLEKEIAEFPDMAQECPQFYLALRNLALAIWALNPKEWVTKEKVEMHVVCRGLARISSVKMLPGLLTFLTRHGFINQGLLSPPESDVILGHCESSVVVIGAGASGLAAAHCLHSHGVKVTVLEAKPRIGGRVSVESPGCEVDAYSGQVLSGCWNNPLAIMAYQLDKSLEQQSTSCPLVTAHGQLVPDDLDRRIEFHYNAILDIVSDWRRGRGPQSDVPLIDKFKEFHEEFIRETHGYLSETTFSQLEVRRLVNFYLSNLEFACGCSLNRASSLYWDQNEDLPQMGGPHMRVPGGFGSILKSLAQNLDIKLGCQVTEVNFSGEKIVVHSSQGDFTADKVVVTVPLAVLQKEDIRFTPPLPDYKVKAIQALGAGKVEKVTLWFAEDFWSQKTKSGSLFGHVPESEDHMGFFNVFYCHYHEEKGTYSVMTHLVGKGLALMEGKSDEEVVDACQGVLQSLFPEKVVPRPVASSVSHWRDDQHTGMAYSYIPVGASGRTYDDISCSVEGRLHFAGEATHRQFPQTVTGAYISGVREAWIILDDLSS